MHVASPWTRQGETNHTRSYWQHKVRRTSYWRLWIRVGGKNLRRSLDASGKGAFSYVLGIFVLMIFPSNTVGDLALTQMAGVIAATGSNPEHVEHVRLNDSYVSKILALLEEGVRGACFHHSFGHNLLTVYVCQSSAFSLTSPIRTLGASTYETCECWGHCAH